MKYLRKILVIVSSVVLFLSFALPAIAYFTKDEAEESHEQFLLDYHDRCEKDSSFWVSPYNVKPEVASSKAFQNGVDDGYKDGRFNVKYCVEYKSNYNEYRELYKGTADMYDDDERY